MNVAFENKTVILTGASSGIGKEIALSLLLYKLKLLLIGRNEVVLNQIVNKPNKKAEIKYMKVDFSNDEELALSLEQIKNLGIEPDIIIHCAGIFHHAVISHTTNEMMDQSYKVNFRAPFIITRDLLDIIKRKKGQIIFINSTACQNPKSNLSAYASSKGALKVFAEVLHQEVYPYGVRVTTLFPGRTATPMQEKVCELEGRDYNPEHFMSTKTMVDLVINLLQLPSNVEISDLTIRPTT
jgi:short-subunit dehydrogenase